MVDFSSLLKRPAGEAKKPPVLPAGDYPAVIKSFELGDQNRNKTPYVRFQLGLLDWPSDGPDSWTVVESDGQTREVTRADVDLSKRQYRRDYFLTDDALWRLDELIRGCGIDQTGRTYEEVLPEMVGTQVLAAVEQYINQTSNEIGNQVGKIVGQG